MKNLLKEIVKEALIKTPIKIFIMVSTMSLIGGTLGIIYSKKGKKIRWAKIGATIGSILGFLFK
jgi:hypothetical protein